ncbi:MAG: hypothetical protein HY695_34285 [Deltaproteobacteria bacterium]|nr:hypothetical protein [Deltaproteobacteria bacterium]
MKKFLLSLSAVGFVLTQVGGVWGQVNVGRFQLVSVSAGQQAGVFLIDTASGCTWQLASNPETKRLTFVEMDIENLHWSWGSGAQQKLGQRIDASKLSEDQKRALKQELNKTACGWTPVVLTPGPSVSSTQPEAPPTKKK